MTTSSCCGSTLSTHCADEGTQCFVCMNCGKPCDAVDWKLQAETAEAERDKALAAASEMRAAIEAMCATQSEPDHGGPAWGQWYIKRVEVWNMLGHALSTSCGTGWLSPDKAKVLREALERIQLCSSSNHDLALEIARNALASIQLPKTDHVELYDVPKRSPSHPKSMTEALIICGVPKHLVKARHGFTANCRKKSLYYWKRQPAWKLYELARAGYRDAVKKCHPDHGGDPKKMYELVCAWKMVVRNLKKEGVEM